MAGFEHFCPFILCIQKAVEMSCFTIQIIISNHGKSFKMFCQKENVDLHLNWNLLNHLNLNLGAQTCPNENHDF